MKKSELKELYQMMFPDYPDIVTVKQLREMLGVSRALAYKLISDGEIQAVKIGTSLKNPQGQRHQLRDRGAKGGEIQCLNESNLLRPNAYGATA